MLFETEKKKERSLLQLIAKFFVCLRTVFSFFGVSKQKKKKEVKRNCILAHPFLLLLLLLR